MTTSDATESEIPETRFIYNRKSPAIVVVDDFYQEPDKVRRLALDAEYAPDNRYFKGARTLKSFLFPYVKEEFERLIQKQIIDWMAQPANGVFQQTTRADPLVYHSDQQDYAAAIYLTPNDPLGTPFETEKVVSAGTSFWMYRGEEAYGARVPARDPDVNAQIYSEHNLLHGDNWHLVDKVGAVYNRLVIWDAKLIHSASTYNGFDGPTPRLVQLYFFNVAK